MIKQYPHFLYVKDVQNSRQDDAGNWITGATEWKFHSICREETNGKGSVIELTDGKMYAFGSLVQCPKGTPGIQEGTTVKVCECKDPESPSRIEAKCAKSSVDQLHTRIWL